MLSQLNIASELISINPGNIHIYEQERCSICNDDFVINEVLRKLNICPHFFHYNCIDTWFIKENTCPYCRFSIKENNVRELNQDLNNINNTIFNIIKYGSLIILFIKNKDIRLFTTGIAVGGILGTFFGIGTTFVLLTHIRGVHP